MFSGQCTETVLGSGRGLRIEKEEVEREAGEEEGQSFEKKEKGHCVRKTA